MQGKHEGEVSYELLKESGPDHDKKYLVEVLVGERRLGRGEGRTKKGAEQEAAYQALLKLKPEETQ